MVNIIQNKNTEINYNDTAGIHRLNKKGRHDRRVIINFLNYKKETEIRYASSNVRVLKFQKTTLRKYVTYTEYLKSFLCF